MQQLSVDTSNDPSSSEYAPTEMAYTRKRLVTAVASETIVEHLRRYALAIDLCDE
jgi:hypothetical protein